MNTGGDRVPGRDVQFCVGRLSLHCQSRTASRSLHTWATTTTMVLRLHGCGAWVESGGKPLEEYAVEVKDNVISCYICSEEGKVSCLRVTLCNQNPPLTRHICQQFVLHFDDDGSHLYQSPAPPNTYGRTVRIRMDGADVDHIWCRFMEKVSSEGMRRGNIVRPYIFAPIATTGLTAIPSMEIYLTSVKY